MSTPKNDGVPLEHPAKSNFGPLLDDFIKEFGCDREFFFCASTWYFGNGLAGARSKAGVVL